METRITKVRHGELTLHLTYFVYPELTKPRGYLEDTVAAQACWYYYTIAMNAREQVGKGPSTQIIYDDELWMDTNHHGQKQSVAKLYGISPEEMDPFWGQVTAQARLMGLPEPHESILLRQIIVLNS